MEYKSDGIVVEGIFIPLKEIVEKCNSISIKDKNLVLLQLGWDGRGGSVFEQRALPLKNALRIKELLLDKRVYFGEIWGKHSEVCGTMCENTFTISKDKNEIKEFLSSYPDGIEYDHSFITAFINEHEENLEYADSKEEYEEETGVTQELIDEIYSLL